MLSISAHENVCTNSGLGNAEDEALRQHSAFSLGREGLWKAAVLHRTRRAQGIAAGWKVA